MLRLLLTSVRSWFAGVLCGWGVPADWAHLITDILSWIVAVVFCIAVMMLAALVIVYLERKVSGWIQCRLGPFRVGPKGIFQTPMDAVKLLLKEDIVPAGADKILHTLGPVVFFTVSLMAWLVVPWDDRVVVARVLDKHVGLLYFMGVSGITILAIIMGGWGSNNKWSLLGACRAAAQILSYEIPMLLALLCVVLGAGSLSLAAIVESQQGAGLLSWNLWKPWLWLPLIIFVVCMFAEIARQPFDLPEAESELVAGYHTEYTGMKFGLYFLGEYANILLISMVVSVLFLGGWLSPFGPADTVIPGFVWLIGKAACLVFFVLWVRWTLPRLRIDQLMSLAWKLLVPAGFLALLVAAVAVGLGAS